MQTLNRTRLSLVRNVLSFTSFDARRSSVQPDHSDAELIIESEKSAGARTTSSPRRFVVAAIANYLRRLDHG